MVQAVLITQNLQMDFCGPLLAHEPPPCEVHVGEREARRMLGADPSVGAVSQLLQWARVQSPDDLQIIHLVEHHDPDDPMQKNHLERFGRHCITGTVGAQMILDIDKNMCDHEQIVVTTALNKYDKTNLGEIMKAHIDSNPDLKVGVIGCETSAGVMFHLYDLKARIGVHHLSTCTALTADHSRTSHFAAIDTLRKTLGIHVTESAATFTDWLLPSCPTMSSMSAQYVHRGPQLTLDGARLPEGFLSDTQHAIISYLYRNSATADIHKLAGGFSGALVLNINAHDALGHVQASSVCKIGRRESIAQERINFERVQEILGNSAPSIRDFIEIEDSGGVKFAFAAMSPGKVKSLESVYTKTAKGKQCRASFNRIKRILDQVFGDILGKFTQVAHPRTHCLLDLYDFDGKGWAYWKGGSDNPDRIFERIADLTSTDGHQERVEWADGDDTFSYPNLAVFMRDTLPQLPRDKTHTTMTSFVHGDLNAQNVILDSNDNVWLIDFEFTKQDHVLKDLLKIEHDLVIHLTSLDNEADLMQGIQITDYLAHINDLAAPLPETPPTSSTGRACDKFARAWHVLRVIRHYVAEAIGGDRHPFQANVVLLRYALHTMCLDHIPRRNREWALASASAHAAAIAARFERNRTLRVDYFDSGKLGWSSSTGTLGITLLPGRKDKGRELGSDVESIKESGATVLYVLLSPEDLEWAGIGDLPVIAAKQGLTYASAYIPERRPPPIETARQVVINVIEHLQDGQRVVLCCTRGLGPSGIIAALVLACMPGARTSASDAIAKVRAVRGDRAIPEPQQVSFIDMFVHVAETLSLEQGPAWERLVATARGLKRSSSSLGELSENGEYR